VSDFQLFKWEIFFNKNKDGRNKETRDALIEY